MDWEKFQSAKAALADKIGCSVAEIEIGFGPLTGYQIWTEQQAQSGQRGKAAAEAKAYAAIIAVAEREYVEIHGKPFDRKCDDQLAGIIKELKILEGAALVPITDLNGDPRKSEGKKNLSAYWIAERIADVFKHTGRNVGYGAEDGFPSTPFGKAVDHAFAVFGIEADWRRPTEAAAKNAKQYQ